MTYHLAILSISACIAVAQTMDGILPQVSPAFLSDIAKPTGVVDSLPPKPYPRGALDMGFKIDVSKYPVPKEIPPTDSPEVKNAVAAIDWSKVPKAPRRKTLPNGSLDVSGYDPNADPDCWWSASICKQPKAKFLPADYYMCPTPGDWGLNYDDGPLNPVHFDNPENWAEPFLYDYLASHNQTATLFYIGSYVITFPTAAQRALNSGNVLCSHTWSHKQMTSLTNEQLVAEFYWSLRAIKEATGVTVKCWRPPFGDVDDRVRSIAHQMGMRTILWDQDSFDWQIGPNLPETTVGERFKKWIADRTSNQEKEHGHITLQHELSADTVKIATKWLPEVMKNFNVMPIHQCMDDTSPYWETSFVYPKRDGSLPPSASQTTPSTSATSNKDDNNKDNNNKDNIASSPPHDQPSSASTLQQTLLPCVTVAALMYSLLL